MMGAAMEEKKGLEQVRSTEERGDLRKNLKAHGRSKLESNPEGQWK